MQIDITRFLNARETEQEKLLLPRQKDSADGVTPTLFGDMAMKRDLACLVLVNGRNVEEGFGLAFRIIQKKDLDLLVKCLKKDVNKVEAYMLAGRLKTAYLLAVRQNRIDHVKRIMAAGRGCWTGERPGHLRKTPARCRHASSVKA
ncbi:hypothetical protein HPB51_011112 [Rhipicephalus microplus]|uniref:ZFYVE26-like TPR repeats domain-containing protein n=1 Tax=Rhipicephalus microplus TaxID=6941 RepID=A0A9J6E0Y9_RHIMP|nr:hypothetical protein HPB51_011112 [Rhipicephalus microplus]